MEALGRWWGAPGSAHYRRLLETLYEQQSGALLRLLPPEETAYLRGKLAAYAEVAAQVDAIVAKTEELKAHDRTRHVEQHGSGTFLNSPYAARAD